MTVQSIRANCLDLFENPFNKENSLEWKVTVVAFHALTLCVPLIIYNIYKACYNFSVEPNYGIFSSIAGVIKKPSIIPYNELESEAMEFAKVKLIEHSDASPFDIYKKLPANSDILKLMTIYWDIYFDKLEKAIKANPDQPWSKNEVIEAAEECMKLGYAISVLTLEDLPAFTEKLPKEEQMYSHALARQDAYMYRTFYYCTNLYHWIRGGIVAKIDADANRSYLGFPKVDLTKEEAVPFYEPGTRQNRWNRLYNAYCNRVRMYVSEKDLRQPYPNGDQRHANWTKADEKFDDFSKRPDTTPT